jgi:hypothetical protein
MYIHVTSSDSVTMMDKIKDIPVLPAQLFGPLFENVTHKYSWICTVKHL